MHDSITIADVGSIVKVSGSRIATPFGPPRPGQHADEDAEHEADHHQRQDLPRQQDGKAVQQEIEGFHRELSDLRSRLDGLAAERAASSGPLGMMTSNAISNVTNMMSVNRKP